MFFSINFQCLNVYFLWKHDNLSIKLFCFFPLNKSNISPENRLKISTKRYDEISRAQISTAPIDFFTKSLFTRIPLPSTSLEPKYHRIPLDLLVFDFDYQVGVGQKIRLLAQVVVWDHVLAKFFLGNSHIWLSQSTAKRQGNFWYSTIRNKRDSHAMANAQ